MSRYLLDTNHLGESVLAVSVVRDRMQQMHRLGVVFGTCVPVLSELWVGLHHRSDQQRCRQRLEYVLQVVRIWPIEPSISELYSDLYHQLRRVGKALSQFDILIASIAIQLDSTLLTSDRDFEALPQLPQQNWLQKP